MNLPHFACPRQTSAATDVRHSRTRAGTPLLFAVAILSACGNGSSSTPVPPAAELAPAAPAAIESPRATASTETLRAPATPLLFGVHFVAAWASPAAFPEAAGIFRMHDATPRWDALHTRRGRWHDEGPPVGKGLGRIDAVLLFRDRHAPDVPVIYVLGGAGSGGSGFPAWTRPGTIRDAWREHVRHIARRYKGRIQYYEVWNEADAGNWYTGSTSLLVDLTRIASQEIRAADPAARVIAPSFTQEGHVMMNDFYSRDVAGLIDIVAWHHGTVDPEADTANIVGARRILRRHGIDKPLWATEINIVGGAAELARTLLVHWLYGVEMVGYYSWEMPTYYGGDDGYVHTTDARGRITAAGVAFGVLRSWIEGRSAADIDIVGDTWSVTLDNGDVITWTAGSPSPVRMAAGTLRRLDGSRAAWPGGVYTPTSQPVLLTSRTR